MDALFFLFVFLFVCFDFAYGCPIAPTPFKKKKGYPSIELPVYLSQESVGYIHVGLILDSVF